VATFPELPAGVPLQVTASAPTFTPVTVSVTPVAGATTARTVALSLENVTLTVDKDGSGSGTVTSSPSGINCGTSCNTQGAQFPFGTVVTLTATPAAGSAFGGMVIFSEPHLVPGLPQRVPVAPHVCNTSPCTFTLNANTRVLVTFTAQTGTVVITVTRAGDGAPISMATVARSGGGSQTTNSSGVATFPNVPAGSPVDFTASAPGFVRGSFAVTPVAGSTTSQTISLAVILPPGEFSIVLTWGANPRDLDSHLTGPAPSDDTDETRFHIYFDDQNPEGADPGLPSLDDDDEDGEGPETITVPTTAQRPGLYRYSVHHFAGTGFICAGSPLVHVKIGDDTVTKFRPPSAGCKGVGDLWTVFTVDTRRGVVTEVGTITPGVDAVSVE
jgi:hypothetical protein